MSRQWIVVLVVVAAVIGGAAGAAVTLLIYQGDDDARVRGALVHLGLPDYLASYTPQPFCLQLHHFCIAQPETGHPVALYTYDPHPIFREWGCEVRWNPDMVYPTDSPNSTRGVFMDPCGGSIYDMTGHRLFGPSPRDLDSFHVDVSDTTTTVDTRSLICGKGQLVDAASGCQRAPAGD